MHLPSIQVQQACHHENCPFSFSQYALDGSPLDHTAPGHPFSNLFPFIEIGKAEQSASKEKGIYR